jgi:hypothetical protein
MERAANKPLGKVEDYFHGLPTEIYIWDGDGPFVRREPGGLVKYIKGDPVELTARGAWYVRGSIKHESGFFIPPEKFDGENHPSIEVPKRLSPHERAGVAPIGHSGHIPPENEDRAAPVQPAKEPTAAEVPTAGETKSAKGRLGAVPD